MCLSLFSVLFKKLSIYRCIFLQVKFDQNVFINHSKNNFYAKNLNFLPNIVNK